MNELCNPAELIQAINVHELNWQPDIRIELCILLSNLKL